MSESDTLALQCVGRILKPARLMAGKGMRQFAQEIGLLPSRISEIETGSAPTAAELKLMADALEAARREGIDWRESTVATLTARESELAEAQRRVAELEGDAERYRYIRDTLAQMLNPKMSGQHTWRVTTIHATGGTFEEVLDKHMAERPIKADRITPTEPEK